jgi:hypothetical protein
MERQKGAGNDRQEYVLTGNFGEFRTAGCIQGKRGQEQNSEGQPVKSNGKGRRCGQFREDRREGNSYNG